MRGAFILITVTISKKYALHQLMLLGRLEIHIALPHLKIDVRIVAQVY